MKKLITFLVLLSGVVLGQVQQATLTTPPPAALNQLNLTIVGGLGQSTYYYYIAVHYPIGTVISNGFVVRNAPSNLSVSNYVRLNWQPLSNATSYDIIRSITPGIFTSGGSGSCVNCLVTTGVTATTYNDTTASLTLSYTLNAPVQSSVRISLDNTTHSTPYLNIDTVAGPTATLNINMPVLCLSGCSGSGSGPFGIGVPYSNNGIAFTSAITGNPTDCILVNGTSAACGSGGTPGGANNDIQVNNAGAFGGGRGTLDASGNLTALAYLKTNTGVLYLGTSANQPFFAYGQLANSWNLADAAQNWWRVNTTVINGMLGLMVVPAAGGYCWPTANDASNAPTLCWAQNALNTVELNTGTLNSFADLKVRTSKATSFVGQDTTHSGLMYLQGLTSGGVALGVDDIAGTAIVYVLPSTNGTAGQYLQDSGVTTCPTYLAGAPTVCHQLIWATVTGTGADTALDNLALVNINTSLFAQTGVDAGSTTKPFRNIYIFGSGTYGSSSIEITGTPTGNRIITIPDATDTLVNLGSTQTLTGKTLTTPTIASFVNATHNHQNAAGGGTLDAAALASGTIPRARGGTNNTAGAIPQLFFGTTAPGSVAGNLPGDIFSDTTNHNIYVCNATSGTAAPACTSVTTNGWTLLNVAATGCTASGGAGVVQASNGSGGCQATTITDNGTTVVTTEPFTAAGFTSSDTAHSGYDYLKGLTSGGVNLAVGDVAGTAITYVMPTTNGVANQALLDSGSTTCPTLPAGLPATCHLLVWTTIPLTSRTISTTSPLAGGGDLSANRTLTCTTCTVTVASGTSALGTGAISSATCATVVTTTATGIATTDVISAGFNGDPTAVTGYIPSTAGMLTIIAYPTANNVNFKVCNNTTASITPGAITLNWRVSR